MTLKDLRDEYEGPQKLGPSILSEIKSAAKRVSRTYPPAKYARGFEWNDDAVEELVQDVTVSRLLDGGQLDYMMAHAVDIQHFRALIDRQVRQELAARRIRTVIDNLLDRSREVLDRMPFAPAEATSKLGRGPSYRLASREVERRPPTSDELRIAAAVVRPLPRLRDSVSDRASIVYTNETLNAALMLLAETLPCSFSIRDVDKIFSEVLTSWLPSFLSQEEGDLFASTQPGPEDLVILRETTAKILAKWTGRELHHFRLLMSGCSFDEVARNLSISRPTEVKYRAELLHALELALADLPETLQKSVLANLYFGSGQEGNR
jgi:hypothetical protein